MGRLTSKDCLTCGICCIALEDQGEYANVTEKDKTQLGKRFVRLHVVQDAVKTKWRVQRSGPLKGVSACACVALRGSLMHQVSCSVYSVRPEVCRKAVKPGDRTCLQVRRMFQELLVREGIE
jgi:Fe-S-cluster containining protein